MFTERLSFVPASLAAFRPVWPLAQRDGWAAIPAAFTERLAERARESRGAWPVIRASDFLTFTRNGDRIGFEAKYMQRRRMLNAFALAECIANDGTYIDDIVDGVLLLCEETGWQLPAHNTYIRDRPALPLPDPDRPVIDLFAAETGAQLAFIAHLFADRLNAVSPQIVERIDAELRRRIITPYLNAHFWWMGNGDEPMNNWTAWCTQNILLTAFTHPFDTQTRRAVIAKAAASLDAFLKDYGEDGACEEGVLYYRHAGLCLFNALTVLSTVAPDAFAPLWQEPKIRNIAEFVMHMHVDGERYFNFADSSSRAGYCGAREFLFGEATGSAALMDFAAASFRLDPAPDQPDEVNLFYRLQTAMTAARLYDHTCPPPKPADRFFPSIGLMVARDPVYALAAKAGNNGESHNHNDTGSFTLYKNGRPFIIDVGVENYTAKTFTARRYEIWTMQSGYHNLASFDGVMQQDGKTFAARDVKAALKDETATLEMELAGAYPPEAGLKSYRRRIALTKGQGIEVEDDFDGAAKATLSLMLSDRPIISPDRIDIEGLGTIAVEGSQTPQLETIAITDTRLRAAWPETLYRVLLPFRGAHLKLQIA